MKAVLMAAGVGSRLAQNYDKPKSTMKIGGISLLQRTVSMLNDNNISVSIVVGYKRHVIFEQLKDYNVNYYYNPFFRVTNSLGSLWFAKEELDCEEDIILANADVFWEQGILDIIKNNNDDIVLLADKSRTDVGDYFFEVKNGVVSAYGKELEPERRSCEYVGVAKLSHNFVPAFLNNMQSLIDKEFYHLWWENALYEYCRQYPVHVQDVNGVFWGEIDSIQDYNRICAYFKENGGKIDDGSARENP